MPETVLNIPKKIASPRMGRVGSNKVNITRNTYTNLSDNDYEQEITVDDDLVFTASGRELSLLGTYIYRLLCTVTLGLFYLWCRWNIATLIYIKTIKCPLRLATHICIINQWGKVSLVPVNRVLFNGSLESVFPTFASRHPEHSSEIIQNISSYEYRYFRFLLNPRTGIFEPNYSWYNPKWKSVNAILSGYEHLSQEDIQRQRLLFGQNHVEIAEKSTLQLLIDEVLHPFFIFQIFSILLWSIDEYYYYATAILLITVSSSTVTLLETKKSISRLRSMSRFSSHVKLWRNGAWTYHKSEDMVPGDIMDIEIEQGTIMPCDAVLLQGDCIFNESMLTGESLPVSKSPISDNELQCLNFDSEEPASSPRMAFYFLFAGTKIIRVRHSQAQKSIVDSYTPDSLKRGAIALVVRTGFNTSKGSLIRSILFPRPNNFRFYQDSFRFIGVLAFISLLGFLVSFQFFIQAGVSWRVIVIRALDLITIAVPPALPATMAIGTSFAISRLRKWSIFCTSPPRVNICGKLNVMCFDKTGTLTEEGLDVLGVRLSSANQENEDFNRTLNDGRSSARFSQLYDNLESIVSKPVSMQLKNSMDRYSSSPRSVGHGRIETPLIKLFKQTSNTVHETCIGFPLMICAMATCHSIKIVHGEKMGDPLDLKMLEFTEWHLEEDFSAEKAITNAVSFMKVYPPWLPEKDLQETVKMGLEIVKSFEFLSTLRRMSVIVSKIGVSTAQEYTVFVKGAPETMYLPVDFNEQLRMYSHHGYRVLAIAYKSIENTDVPREEAECNLNFLGFIVFENKLKPGTTTVINTLSKAKIRQIMCTGDNLLTSISVARQCSLVSQNHKTFVPRFLIGQSHEEDAVIEWYDVDNVDNKLNSETLIPIDYGAAYNYHLAITGDVFQWMLDFSDDDTFDRMLVMCQIFARMSPDLKHFLVENLQSLGYCVGFCGDGTNDCGALKSADAGLSLSEAEASVAAPFTSKQKDLDCVLRLIREGRAALVTSFCCFKYMALYSLIQFTSVILLYSLKQNVNDFQFMYIDLALIIPVAVFMGQTGPHPQIHRKQPTAKLLSKKVLTSVFGQIIIQGLMQYIAFRWVQSQPWYVPGNVDIANEMYESFENTIVFMVSSYQYLIVAVVFTVGPPYQESILKNTPYIITLSLLLAANLAMTFLPSNVIPFDLVQVPVSARIFVVIIAASDLVMSWVCEIYIFPRAASIIGDFAERVMYRLYEQSPIEAMDIHTASKMYKWSQNGKRYKIIEKLIE